MSNANPPRGCSRLMLLIGLLVQSGLASGQPQPQRHPNILWITAEDLSPRLGCYGDQVASTPNLDRLASEGQRYTNAFATYGVCAPARHTIITGMYPVSTGAMHMRTNTRTAAVANKDDPRFAAIPLYEATPPAGVRCFTEYLRAAGYYCTNHSKTDYQFTPPVTAWDASGNQAHWRNRPSSSTPFFAVFNFNGTHESKTFKKTFPEVTNPADVVVPPYYPDTPTVRKILARHYDNIHGVDQQIGKLIGELKEDGLYDNTYIFFYGDHGDGLIRAKRWVYDSGIRIPLLIRCPGGQDGGTAQSALVSFVDLAPTVLSLASIPIPDYMQGQAFLGTAASPPRQFIYACRDRMDVAPETIRAVRDNRYKYIRNYRPELPYVADIPYRNRSEMVQEILALSQAGQLGESQWQLFTQQKPKEELYDTHTDPHEIHNRIDDPELESKLRELREAHLAWERWTGDLGHVTEFELVKQLWPPDGTQPTTEPPKFVYADGKLTLRSNTAGASIGYRLNKKQPWRLYSEQFTVQPGDQVSAQAHRLGWKPSVSVNYSAE